jgi:hypothetical protein
MELPVPAGASVTVGELKLVVRGLAERDTVPENPFTLARSIFEVSDPPCASVI